MVKLLATLPIRELLEVKEGEDSVNLQFTLPNDSSDALYTASDACLLC